MSAVSVQRKPLPDASTESAVILPFGSRGCPTTARRNSEISAGDLDRLNRLRWLALKSKLAPKPDIERACFLLSGTQERAIEPVANAFFRGLVSHGSRTIDLHRPGTRNPSSDEIWMLRLLSAFDRGEEKEGAALVSWRVRPQGRRWMRFLAASLAALV
ncbi:hypothetical protein U0C82_16945 [Fulvimarina sp. 2208YS6-2-32]|uniref:Uncharacterized protein n=1 Tax=Fulvimarina uroteuthidis TaxID=3098149 RepID=A0ABU5I7M8_9HYPH|nr:hypothetical protein [Fulvimarina sp. 2208YS6-2-32]MDY8110828.1 hypothetical protein [Fulvimarina sp. 2208YS6-2-32]